MYTYRNIHRKKISICIIFSRGHNMTITIITPNIKMIPCMTSIKNHTINKIK